MQMIPGDPFSLSTPLGGFSTQEQNTNPNPKPNAPTTTKKKRNLPGTPDPDAEVIALSPKTLMATNRFVCEICNKGFQRDQNLQLHRRGHNLPWKLRQRSNKEVRKKVYICPEKTCVHHDASRALGDLTGIKKHFSRKHGEKKWKCEKCSKKYAVQSDWKAHTKTCGTREYKCDCGTLFSRKDSFITHRAFCDALAEESARLTSVTSSTNLNFKDEDCISLIPKNFDGSIPQFGPHGFRLDFNHNNNSLMGAGDQHQHIRPSLLLWLNQANPPPHHPHDVGGIFVSSSLGLPEIVQMQQPQVHNNGMIGSSSMLPNFVPGSNSNTASLSLSEGQNKQSNSSKPASPMSATALLQKAAQMGSTRSSNNPSIFSGSFGVMTSSPNSSQTTTTLNNNSHNGNEINQVFQAMKQPQDFTSNGGEAIMGNSASFSSMAHSSNAYDQLVMQNNGKMKLHLSNAADHNLTRDFLGVSGGGAGPQFLPQELAKFLHP